MTQTNFVAKSVKSTADLSAMMIRTAMMPAQIGHAYWKMSMAVPQATFRAMTTLGDTVTETKVVTETPARKTAKAATKKPALAAPSEKKVAKLKKAVKPTTELKTKSKALAAKSEKPVEKVAAKKTAASEPVFKSQTKPVAPAKPAQKATTAEPVAPAKAAAAKAATPETKTDKSKPAEPKFARAEPASAKPLAKETYEVKSTSSAGNKSVSLASVPTRETDKKQTEAPKAKTAAKTAPKNETKTATTNKSDPVKDMPALTAGAPAKKIDTGPSMLDKPRGGKADDLTKISGVGAQMKKTLNKMGVYHFDQVASWTKDQADWIDVNLPGVKGRVGRDEWVKQAKALLDTSKPGK